MSANSTHEYGENGASKEDGMTYAQAGVSIDAGNALVDKIKPIVKRTKRVGADSELGGFGGLFDLKAAGFKDPIIVAANDGVGTKLKIAIDTGIHHTIGIDLVAMCVNDLIVQGAEPLFFLDYYATGKLNPEEGAAIISGIAEGCIEAGCALIGGETAEMPGLYKKGDYDLAGFAVGAVERGEILPKLSQIKDGDCIIGLKSSGVHSNGYSLVRRVVENSGVSWQDRAPFSSEKSLAEAFLEPTRIYVKPLLKLLRADIGDKVRALAHITGGGFVENIPRVLPQGFGVEILLDNMQLPPIFSWLAMAGKIAEKEMLRTFNCGIGMILLVDNDYASEIITKLIEDGEEAIKLGHIIQLRDGKEHVTFQGKLI